CPSSEAQRRAAARRPTPGGGLAPLWSREMPDAATAGRPRTARAAPSGERGLDASDVAVLVHEDLDVDEAGPGQVVLERGGLVAAELEQEGAPAPEEARAAGHDAAEDVGAI